MGIVLIIGEEMVVKLNLIGQKFGDLEIVQEVHKPKHLKRNGFYWLARCSCGKEVIGITQSFVHEGRKHCGCKKIENLSKSHKGNGIVDIIGKRFGQLTVIRQDGVGTNNKIKYLCKCDCGNFITTLGSALRRKEKSTSNCHACARKVAALKISGKNHYLWSLNLTEEDRKKRDGSIKSREEYRWRKKVLQRDKYICQICYKKHNILNAHHINSYSEYDEIRFDERNGVCLCVECHKDFHKFYGISGATKAKYDSYLEYRKNIYVHRCR